MNQNSNAQYPSTVVVGNGNYGNNGYGNPIQINYNDQSAVPHCCPGCVPCPCTTGQCGAKAVAIVHMIMEVFMAIIILIFWLQGEKKKLKRSYYHTYSGHELSYSSASDDLADLIDIVIALTVIAIIIEFILAIILYIGAERREIGKCKAWLVWTIITFVFYCLGIFYQAVSPNKYDKNIWGIIFGAIIRGYMIWIVCDFIEELKVQSQVYQYHAPGVGVNVVYHTVPQSGPWPTYYNPNVGSAISQQQYEPTQQINDENQTNQINNV